MKRTSSIVFSTEKRQVAAFERMDADRDGDFGVTLQLIRWDRGGLEECRVEMGAAAAKEFGEWLAAWAKEHGA